MISVQLVDHVVDPAGGPKNQSEVDAMARAFRDRVLETVSRGAAKFPDKKMVNFVEGIARETVTRLYDDAAEQVSRTTALHFGEIPSQSHN